MLFQLGELLRALFQLADVLSFTFSLPSTDKPVRNNENTEDEVPVQHENPSHQDECQRWNKHDELREQATSRDLPYPFR